MEKDNTKFDEDFHHKMLAEVSSLLEALGHDVEVGHIQHGSRLAQCAQTMARLYDPYKELVLQTVMSVLIDTQAREANKQLILKTDALKREIFFKAGELTGKAKNEANLLNIISNQLEVIKELKMQQRQGGGQL